MKKYSSTPRLSPGYQPLPKRPEESGYEICEKREKSELCSSNNQRLGSEFDDLDPKLSLLCQVKSWADDR